MSYHAFEELTWNHRKSSGWVAFNRLKPWLKSTCIDRQKRLYLWRICIHTILTYGLLATNVTVKALHDYQAVVYRMLRIVIGDHPYRTRHTHQQVLHLIQHPTPLSLLQRLAMGTWTRLQMRSDQLASDDFLFRVDWSHIPDIQHLLSCLQDTSSAVPIGPAASPVNVQAAFSCEECSFVTHSLANLRRHCTTQHGRSQYRTSPISFLAMSLNGQPKCNHCHKIFTTWRRFCIHVERDCCQASHQVPSAPLSSPALELTATDRALNLQRALHDDL